MIPKYIIFFLRGLRKNKSYSIINILGLSIGLFTCILMLLYVDNELKYDSFHENADNIYRVTRVSRFSENLSILATTMGPYAPALLNKNPGAIEKAVRFYKYDALVSIDAENRFQENRLFFVDPEVFEVFTFPLIRGDKNALSRVFTIVITQEIARKYFGSEDPIGKTLTLQNEYDFEVTGVTGELPGDSHLNFDFLASFASVEPIEGDISIVSHRNVFTPPLYTYLLIPDKSALPSIENSFPETMIEMYGESNGPMVELFLQPLTDIHLKSHLEEEIEANSDVAYVFIISAIAFLVLFIACINFMNLSTSKSAKRAKEVGIKKVVGAHRKHLVVQFLTESIGFSVLSLMVAVFFVYLYLPSFNEFTGKTLSLNLLENIEVFLSFIVLVLFVGFLSGSYPSFFLSAFTPIKVLRGTGKISSGNSTLRKAFIVIQFAISIILIAGTLVIKDQMSYVSNKRLGMNKDQVVGIAIRDASILDSYEVFKNNLNGYADVISVSLSSDLPFSNNISTSDYQTPQSPEGTFPIMKMFSVDYDFIETMEMNLKEGRDFNREMTDLANSYILNEAAVKKLGWDDPLNRQFGRNPRHAQQEGVEEYGTVIGIVEDFHFESLKSEIDPLAMYINPGAFKYFTVKTRAENFSNTLSFLENEWEKISPGRPFEYIFLDDAFAKLYEYERKLGSTFSYFTFLAIFVACLGLFGLISFTAEQRSKEIGVRKVLGASVPDIVSLLSKEYIKLVIFANLIAWPLGIIAAQTWLEQFAYRIDVSYFTFFLSTVITVALALITVGFQALRAAYSDPIQTLRHE